MAVVIVAVGKRWQWWAAVAGLTADVTLAVLVAIIWGGRIVQI